jgi:hypothetical protein
MQQHAACRMTWSGCQNVAPMLSRMDVHCAAASADEPSTGLDPVSRRLLWQVVRRAARHQALVLTTHSLEEAEALCGRIGIFVAGQLRCVGTPQELAARSVCGGAGGDGSIGSMYFPACTPHRLLRLAHRKHAFSRDRVTAGLRTLCAGTAAA